MITGLILAAGSSRRMERPKLVLPWAGGVPLITHVVQVFLDAGASPVIVVTGADVDMVSKALGEVQATKIFNPAHEEGEMLSSIQVGLASLGPDVDAAAICPGDLPYLQVGTVRALLARWRERPSPILAPSFERRRGHPMILAREEWPGVLALEKGSSLREFLRTRAEDIAYYVVADEGVVRDVDLPADYLPGAP